MVSGSYNSWYVCQPGTLHACCRIDCGYLPLARRSWVRLIHSLRFSKSSRRVVCAGDTSLGRYNRNARMRVQKAENVNKALEFITSRGVKLTNIGPEGN